MPTSTTTAANPPQPRSSLRSVGLVTLLTFAQLCIQFALQLLLAKYFGAAGEMDAYVAALALPVVVATILSGSLGYVLIPVFAERLASAGERPATAVTSQIGLYLVGASLLATGLVAVAAGPITALLNPGFSATQQALTAELLQTLAILIVANSLVTFLNALYQCRGQFASPAVAGVSGTLVTLGYVFALHDQQGIHAVAWGVVAGAAVTAAILLPRWISDLRFAEAWRLVASEGTRRAVWLLLPLVIGTIYWRLDPLVDRFLGSYLAPGSIAHLGYAWRLASALMLIGTSGLSVVVFPAIAAHAAAGRREEVRGEIAHALRLLLVLLVPVAVGLAAFSLPVVRLLFERGKFSAADTQAVALLVMLYVGVIVGANLGDLFSRVMYALHDTWTPVVIGMIGFTLGVGLKLLLVTPQGAAGLVAATSAFYLFNAALLTAVLLRRLGRDILAGTAGTLLRCGLATAAACLAALMAGQMFAGFAVLPAAAVGAGVYLLALRLMGDEFAVKLQRFLLGAK